MTQAEQTNTEIPMARYRVEFYSDGLWCVADYLDERATGKSPVVRYHESVGWHTTFSDRADAEALADKMNSEAR